MFNMKVRLAEPVIDRATSVLYRSPVLIKNYPQGAHE